MRKLREVPQRIQIRQLGQIILRQDQAREVRDRVRDRGLDACDTIPREEERVQPWGQGEVGEDRDIVVCEVDSILVLTKRFSSCYSSVLLFFFLEGGLPLKREFF